MTHSSLYQNNNWRSYTRVSIKIIIDEAREARGSIKIIIEEATLESLSKVSHRVLLRGCPRSVTESSLRDGIFFRGQSPSPLWGMGFFFYHHVRWRVRGGNYVSFLFFVRGQSPSSLWGMGFFFYHHVRRRVRGGNYVSFLFFVCLSA
jgi:hypothetical protein